MRVLVADDEPTSRLLLRRSIERLSHDCEVAADGLVAWEMLESGDFEVLTAESARLGCMCPGSLTARVPAGGEPAAAACA